MTAGLSLDLLLIVMLLGVATRALFTREPFNGAVMYIAFGLLMSLAWARLRAPDIALAEAAIGAGLTGALLIHATRRTGPHSSERPRRTTLPAIAGAAVLGGALLAGLFVQPWAEGLAAEAASALPDTGVEHPVTGVLLNLRAYDTWLEIGVLLLAVVAALTARGTNGHSGEPLPAAGGGSVVGLLIAAMVPVLVLVSGLLLWLGTRAPGGAFQAGAVLGSAALLMLVLSRWSAPAIPTLLHRLLLGAGFGVFLVVALIPTVAGGAFLEMRGGFASTAIIIVELALTVSIATALALLFAAARAHTPRAR